MRRDDGVANGGEVIGLCRAIGLIGACAMAFAIAPIPRGHAAEDAAARLGRALAAAEAQNGVASPRLLPVIAKLAQAHQRDGALGDAAMLRRRALDIAIATFGADSVEAAEAMAALAMLDIDRRRYLDAEPLLIIAHGLLKDRASADQRAVAMIDAGLARITLARGKLNPAERWARHAVAAAQAAAPGRSAEALRTLGAVLTAEERFDEAERVLNEAVSRDREQRGADAADTARSLSQLGNLYLRAGRAKKALPPLEEATAIDQQRLGPTHPFIADDLHDLGLAYEALHRGEEAHRAFVAAIAVLDRGAGRDTPRVAYVEIELSHLDRQRGDTAASVAAFRDARRILNKAEAEERKRERRA